MSGAYTPKYSWAECLAIMAEFKRVAPEEYRRWRDDVLARFGSTAVQQ